MKKGSKAARPRATAALTGTILSLAVSQVLADAAAEEPKREEVVVTGTRVTGVEASESSSPIQVLESTELTSAGKPDLMNALANIVPSFTAQAFGGDMANQTLQAKLRGLSPNHVLVLVNGKRRHTTASLAVLGGPYQGGAGVDLNFIPVDSIDHVEVLTEGAAAQYGTDAIAGVINIILKKDSSGGDAGYTHGAFYKGDGDTDSVTGSMAFAPSATSFVNFAGEWREHEHTSRGDIDPRVLAFTAGGTLLIGALVGLAPAFRATQAGVNESLKESGRGTTVSRRRAAFAKALIVIQIALSLLLVLGAGLFLRKLHPHPNRRHRNLQPDLEVQRSQATPGQRHIATSVNTATVVSNIRSHHALQLPQEAPLG